MIIVATIIAIKYNEDKYLCNKSFAKIGGIPVKELNFLESEFFRLIKHELYVNELYYNNCYNYFLKESHRITYFDQFEDDSDEAQKEGLNNLKANKTCSTKEEFKKSKSICALKKHKVHDYEIKELDSYSTVSSSKQIKFH